MGSVWLYEIWEFFNVMFNLELSIIISSNGVFGDIMVLASPPIDHDDVNTLTKKIYNGSLSSFI